MAVIKDAVARSRRVLPTETASSVAMSGSLGRPTRRRTALVILAATGPLMGILTYSWGEAPVGDQNAILFLGLVPFAAATGAFAGLVLRRPRAGAWAFVATMGGAFVGHIAHALLVDSRVYPWGPSDWAVVELTSVLNSLLIGAPAGALGYTLGAAKLVGRASTASSLSAVAVGSVPLFFGLVMTPVAAYDWATGYLVTMAFVGILLGTGVAMILGGVWNWYGRPRSGPATGSPGASGSSVPPPPVP